TDCRDDEIDLGVVAVLKLAVPAIKHLQDRSADANRQDRAGDEPARVHHRAPMITRKKRGRQNSTVRDAATAASGWLEGLRTATTFVLKRPQPNAAPGTGPTL